MALGAPGVSGTVYFYKVATFCSGMHKFPSLPFLGQQSCSGSTKPPGSIPDAAKQAATQYSSVRKVTPSMDRLAGHERPVAALPNNLCATGGRAVCPPVFVRGCSVDIISSGIADSVECTVYPVHEGVTVALTTLLVLMDKAESGELAHQVCRTVCP